MLDGRVLLMVLEVRGLTTGLLIWGRHSWKDDAGRAMTAESTIRYGLDVFIHDGVHLRNI